MAAISSASFQACSRIQSSPASARALLLLVECHFEGDPGALWHTPYVPRTASQVLVARPGHMGDEATGVAIGLDFAHGAPDRLPRPAPPIEAWDDRRRNPACFLPFEHRLPTPDSEFDPEPRVLTRCQKARPCHIEVGESTDCQWPLKMSGSWPLKLSGLGSCPAEGA